MPERLESLRRPLAFAGLVALAAARDGRVDLLSWDQPWRRSFSRPTRKARIAVKLPAHAVVSWDDEATACFLLPDLATFPLRVHLETLRRLTIFRQVVGGRLPTIIVATTDARRSAWARAFDDLARSQQDAPLTARVVNWRELGDDPSVLRDVAGPAQPPTMRDVHRQRLRPLGRRQPGGLIPRPVGTVLRPGSTVVDLGRLALGLTSMERSLLDVVGRHPFLPAESLATVLGWDVRRLRARRAPLVRLGLIRLLDVDAGGDTSASALAELTRDGLELVAAQQGLSLARAVRLNGLAGGGPEQLTGSRRLLLRNLDHTRGVDAIFVQLIRTLRATAGADNDRLLEWRNAVACGRRRMRPDGYGMIRRVGKLHGFFLEYDRGTMSARDYGEKWAAYYDYRDSRAFERDYDGFPTILVVTADNASEERIARSARAAAVGRRPSLPLLLTCEWRIADDPANADGLLGRIWREPHGSFADRRPWPGRESGARRGTEPSAFSASLSSRGSNSRCLGAAPNETSDELPQTGRLCSMPLWGTP